jgi:CTP:molybdopterin cytidylyltransferase MocA
VTKVPLVCQADLFDLTVADVHARPDKEMGYQAAKAAMESSNYRDGNYGAGCGATVGKIKGMETCMKTGIGSYAVQIGELKLGAVVAVNALGDIYDWKTGKKVAGLLSDDKKSFCKTEDVMYRADTLPENMRRDTVDVNLLHKVISSEDGGRKGVRGDFRVFLNQVDDDIDRLAASYRLQQILSVFGIQTAWGSLQDQSENTETSAASDGDIKIAIILEAAGNSTRFGSNKLLYIMDDGRPMAGCVMDTVCEAEKMLGGIRFGKVGEFHKILVTQYEEVAALAPDFDVVMNGRPDLGISHSMQLGIKAAGDADAYMFCVCDQPYIRPETICSLIDEYKKGTAGIVSLSWKGEMRNPKIFSSKYRNELLSLSGDTGGRQIIAKHSDDISLMEAGSEAEVRDIDS